MSFSAHCSEVERLTRLLASGTAAALGAIPWASPVLAFGRVREAVVASLGLNPSNLEFVGADGKPLRSPENRFETLKTLGLRNWASASAGDAARITSACDSYFMRRPYDAWFKRLNKVLVGTGASYYDEWSPACHLDLVPFATAVKWSALDGANRGQLLRLGAPTLVTLLLTTRIRVLVLNGASVVRAFGELAGQGLASDERKDWTLSRSGSVGVTGLAYFGVVSTLAGVSLDRELLVLGFNHNIQSSYGVTNEVVDRIGNWIANASAEVLK